MALHDPAPTFANARGVVDDATRGWDEPAGRTAAPAAWNPAPPATAPEARPVAPISGAPPMPGAPPDTSDHAVPRDRAAAGESTAGPDPRSPRARIAALVDPGSFRELGGHVRHRSEDAKLRRTRPAGDAVVTGHASVDGRPVCVFSQDASVFGGSLGEVVSEKICRLMDLAVQVGCPIVGINDSAGARIQEGVAALAGVGELFMRNIDCSGVVPQVSLVVGSCAGGAVYSPAITDFVGMVDDRSRMFITGPEVVRAVTGEEIGLEALGGTHAHSTRSGVAHFAFADEAEAFEQTRRLLSFLPQNNLATTPSVPTHDAADRTCGELQEIVPADPAKPYDVRDVVDVLVDDGDFLEVQERFARNVVIGFGRIAGEAVGIVGNQPQHLAGVLDIDAAAKAARFVRTCDAFNVPIVTLVDVPGFLPGATQEWGGIIRHGAKLLYAYGEATVPKVTVVLRKAYGGAYDVMGSKHLRADFNFAWPQAELAVMGAEGAVNVLHRRELATCDEPGVRRAELVDDYRRRFSTPRVAAERGYLDDVIEPAGTRAVLADALAMLRHKRPTSTPRRKHGNLPL